MTIATAANAVAPTLRTVAPFPEDIIIITMPVIIIAELDIRISVLAINNAEQPISVSRLDTHFPAVFKCKCKSVDCAAVGWYAPPATLTELLLMVISNISPIPTSPKGKGDWSQCANPFSLSLLSPCGEPEMGLSIVIVFLPA